MKEFKSLVRSTASIATLAAGILLLAVAPGNAGHRGDNNSSQSRGDDAKLARTTANPDRHDVRPAFDERRGGDKSSFDHAKFDRSNTHGNEQDHKRGNPGGGGERIGDGRHKLPSPGGKPVESAAGKPSQTVAGNPVASSSGSSVGATPAANSIHPIASPPAGNVTVSNGVTKYEIPNGAGGVSAYSSGPGKITVTNGKDSVTLNGSSVTVSNALGVGAAQNNVQVGARNGEGKTVVSVAPQKTPAPAAGDITTGPGSVTVTGKDVLKTFGKVTDGVALLSYVPPLAAGYGLAKGGVKGAIHEVKETAEVLYGFFAW
jgi:hypothetical protein